jgi:DNA invertase Pin-like site-specific DNA recombinase
MSGRVGRPAGGGRTPPPAAFTATSATAELLDELGEPYLEIADRVQLLIWQQEADGDGILAARLSGRELQGGETAMGQVHPQREMASRLGLRPRLIVVSVNNSGRRRYEERPDFRIIEEAIDIGWCRWVSWRGPDRIARDVLPAEIFYDVLKQRAAVLYLSDRGGLVDWQLDRVYLRTLGLVSAEEAIAIKERTQTAIRTRYPEQRRGWPGNKRFGFRRNWATKFLEVHPEQWEFVKRIHFRYAELEQRRGSGLRGLQAELLACGCELSVEQIRKILRDPIYITGEFTARVDGVAVAQRPIPLDDPIPEPVFQRNQELLALRSARESTTPVGWFCLNGVPVRHRRCAHLRNDRNLQTFLKGRILSSSVEAYRHSPWVPSSCRGYVLDRAVLEPPIMAALRSLCVSSALASAWDARQLAHARGFTPQLLDAQLKRFLRSRIRNRELQKAQLTRGFLERLDDGERVNEHAYWQLVGAVDAEIVQLRQRLARAVAEPAVGDPVCEHALAESLASVLSDEVPDDDGRRLQRAALVQALVAEIELTDADDGSIDVRVYTLLQ